MAADNRAYDGHTMLFGMDADLDPSALDAYTTAKAVNRTFRGGKNRTRPPFIHKPFVFMDEADRDKVTYGNVQGAFAYRKTRAARYDCIVASIAGSIYTFRLVNEKFVVQKIFDGNSPKLMHAWFVQAQDWLYIQNGFDKPIFWDGVTARRANWPDEPEMPVGTIMVYAFGRVFLSDAVDQVAASDIIYGTGFTTTSNTQRFTDNTYWNEGGSFGMPTNLGHVTGMIVTASQNKGNTYGQGLVLVLGDDGAQAIDASVSRDSWKDASVQSVLLTGQGCLAPGSVVNTNNRTIFRSDDGISVYQNLQIDQANQLSFGKFSQSVNNWLDEDTPSLIRYASMIVARNRVICTVSPWSEATKDIGWGNHHYHRGMVVLDLDRSAEKLTGKPVAWDGLWTGIRPTVLVNGKFDGVKRGFAFSFDADGQNRLFEIAASGLNDQVDDTPIKTKWFYHTKRFDWVSAQTSNTFERKKIVGGELHLSELRDRCQIQAAYRSDNRPDWNKLMDQKPYGPKMEGFNFTAPREKPIKFLTPDDHPRKGDAQSPAHGLQHQVMVKGEGSVRVERLRVAMAPGGNDPNIPVGETTDRVDDPGFQNGLDGVLSNDYEYLIVKP